MSSWFLSRGAVLLSALALAGCVTSRQATNMSASIGASALDRAVLLLQVEARSSDPALRANCIEALQPLHDNRSEDVIEQGLRDPEEIVRFAAAMATGRRRIGVLKPVVQRLATTDPSNSVRVAAIYACARMGDNRHMSDLAVYLADPSAPVRANAAMVLGDLGDHSAIPLLESRRDETNTRVRFELAVALAKLGNSDGTNALIADTVSKFLEDHLVALTAWPEVPAEQAADVLQSGLKAKEPEVQLVAARGLGKLGNPVGEAAAEAYTSDASPRLRALAALALGDIIARQDPDQAAAPIHRLEAMLDDGTQSVRIAAAAAIVNAEAPSRNTATAPGGH